MRTRIVLAAFLLSVGLCFVPPFAYCDVQQEDPEEFRGTMYESTPDEMKFYFLEAKVSYMMRDPHGFLNVWLNYDHFGNWYEWMKEIGDEPHYRFLRGIGTKRKAILWRLGTTEERFPTSLKQPCWLPSRNTCWLSGIRYQPYFRTIPI